MRESNIEVYQKRRQQLINRWKWITKDIVNISLDPICTTEKEIVVHLMTQKKTGNIMHSVYKTKKKQCKD